MGPGTAEGYMKVGPGLVVHVTAVFKAHTYSSDLQSEVRQLLPH